MDGGVCKWDDVIGEGRIVLWVAMLLRMPSVCIHKAQPPRKQEAIYAQMELRAWTARKFLSKHKHTHTGA